MAEDQETGVLPTLYALLETEELNNAAWVLDEQEDLTARYRDDRRVQRTCGECELATNWNKKGTHCNCGTLVNDELDRHHGFPCFYAKEHDPLKKQKPLPLPTWEELTEKEQRDFKNIAWNAARIGPVPTTPIAREDSSINSIAVGIYNTARASFHGWAASPRTPEAFIRWAKNRRMGVSVDIDGNVKLISLSEAGRVETEMEFTEEDEPNGKFDVCVEGGKLIAKVPSDG